MAVPGMPELMFRYSSASVLPWKKTPVVRFGPVPPVAFVPWHGAQCDRKIFAPAALSAAVLCGLTGLFCMVFCAGAERAANAKRIRKGFKWRLLVRNGPRFGHW